MTENDATISTHRPGLPVRTIRVTVLEGADRGKEIQTEEESLRIGTADTVDLQLSDPTASRFHLELRRDHDRIRIVDHQSTNGTLVASARLNGAATSITGGTELIVGHTRLLVSEGDVVMRDLGPAQLGELRGESAVMRALFAKAERVAASGASVLLAGESGTGKELLAHAIHERSQRAAQPFVTVDCGAISPSLFASELFGHERGSFTGADRQHIGAFERADGGTLFLDEIGELSPDQQAALLGALERGRFRRVGGTAEVSADVRVVSATHRDLRSAVNDERFRLDLFYRLAVVTLRLPSLSERPDDIPALIEHFLATDHPTSTASLFSRDEVMRLRKLEWPGNVRELRNYVASAVALGEFPSIDERPAAGADVIESSLDRAFRDAKKLVTEEFERRYLTAALERADGNMRQAARDTKMNRSYLMELLRRHGLR